MMGKRLLFVCLGNACRSIMAEALMRHHQGGTHEAASAGIQPLGRVPAETMEVLEEIGVSTEGLRSKGLWQVDLDRFDCIVNLSEYPLEGVIPARLQKKVIDCYVRDPFGGHLDSFRRARDSIERLITGKIPFT